MKKFTSIICLPLLLVCYAADLPKHTGKKDLGKNGFVVVELFTSEGCSSCPAADNNVGRLLAKKMNNVFILSFHVDYWNRLGWKDVFSDAQFSKRQRSYASTFGLGSVYTPQVVVNGSAEFVGSDENKLDKAVGVNLMNNQQSELKVSVEKTDNKIAVAYNIESNSEVLLNLAFVQPAAITNVRGGENGGKSLHHVNIVRSFTTITTKGSNRTLIALSKDLEDTPLELIAFTQDKTTMQVLSAAQQTIQK